MSLKDFASTIVKPRLHHRFEDLLIRNPQHDDEDGQDDEIIGDQDEGGLAPIGGLNLVIEYKDSKGKASQRVVTCRRLEVRADKRYVQAYCHHRSAIRSFRIDRVVEIFDPITGESLNPVDVYFAQFSANEIAKSGVSWGLSVQRRGSLIALLNALVFIARCDKDFHHSERECVEQAVTKFWLEYDLSCDCDIDSIMNYAARLSPDGEMFWLAMHKFKADQLLGKIFKRHARLLIEADGIVKDIEAYWMVEIDDALSG